MFVGQTLKGYFIKILFKVADGNVTLCISQCHHKLTFLILIARIFIFCMVEGYFNYVDLFFLLKESPAFIACWQDLIDNNVYQKGQFLIPYSGQTTVTRQVQQVPRYRAPEEEYLSKMEIYRYAQNSIAPCY